MLKSGEFSEIPVDIVSEDLGFSFFYVCLGGNIEDRPNRRKIRKTFMCETA